MRAVVTGANGFMGQALVRALLAQGHAVTATSAGSARPIDHPRLTWAQLDLGRPNEGWEQIFHSADVIHHLAWSTVPSEASRAPVEDARVNIVGSLSLIQAVRDAQPAARIVFASSGGTVYGALSTIPATEDHPLRPMSAHGVSKLAVESYLEVARRESGLSSISLRIGNLYGPGQSRDRMFGAVTQFALRALFGEPIRIFGDGSVTRDYVFIDDVVDALALAGSSCHTGPFNIGTGVGHSLNDVAKIVAAEAGHELAIERLGGRAFDVPVSILDPSRANAALGWQARMTFKEGVRKTLDAMRAALQPSGQGS
jgi:UDP-glucose 4-epimerase